MVKHLNSISKVMGSIPGYGKKNKGGREGRKKEEEREREWEEKEKEKQKQQQQKKAFVFLVKS